MDRKEKLEEAKKLYETANADQKYVLESLFPELKESEGERIRKALIQIFNVENFENYGIKNEEVIAWLEKQVEQKPVEWSQVDLISLGYLADFVDKNGDAFYGKNKPNVVKWVRSFAELPTHEHINDIEQKLWSEEDEDAIAEAIIALEDMYDPDEPERCYAGYTLTFDKAAERLKSLRHQSQWKPSEGQLECLGYAIEKAEKDWSPLTNNRIYLTLKVLKEQLEKLREE